MTLSKSHVAHSKLSPSHIARRAVVYLRQSTERQVQHNKESQALQYALAQRAQMLGCERVEVIDDDLGCSAAVGAPRRQGFERLLAAVALGDIGIVFSRELSRLSRTDTDWCRLLELCQIFDTLVGDAEQLYDLNLLDDQLVLGIKGTLSVVELKVIRQRLYEGTLNKARRGELIRMPAPGYVLDGQSRLVKDPDLRVQEAMGLVFTKFRETGSARQTFRWFHDSEIELPVNKSRDGRWKMTFQLPRLSFVTAVLRNPIYAGAYVYGRRPTQKVLVDGQIKKRQRSALPLEQARVFIANNHEAYIGWDDYQENLRMLRNNVKRWEPDDSIGAVRAGKGLLTGLLRCRHCGRKLQVRYWGKSGTAARYLCEGDYELGGKYCLGFGGSTVDRRFSEQVLVVICPLGLEASLLACAQLQTQDDEQRGALKRQLEQSQFEVMRAFEQYDQVDPRNRLVAAELERRYNEKLEQQRGIEAKLVQIEGERTSLSVQEQDQLRALGECFEQVWHSPLCPPELKKRIVRTLVEEVLVAEQPQGTLDFVVRYKGGVHTSFTMPKPRAGVGEKTADQDLDIITKMGARYGDDQIARVLNKLGRTTGKGKRWNEIRVATARRNHCIAGQKHATPNPDLFSLNAAARHLNVSDTTIRRLVDANILPCSQLAPWAPWEINRCDLESDAMRRIIQTLHSTGKLVLQGDRFATQQSLF